MRIVSLNEETKKGILTNLLKRSTTSYGSYMESVNEILTAVREKGDEALFSYTEQFDHVKLTKDTIRVSEEEIEEAYRLVDENFLRILRRAAENIRDYHQRQVRNSWIETKADGVLLGQKITPLSSVGVYVPGGKAAYPSSVLMNLIPAKVAGVKRIAMVTPPGRDGKVNPKVLAAAREGGVTEIYKVGGCLLYTSAKRSKDTLKNKYHPGWRWQ